MEGEDKIVESMRRFANDAKCVEYLKTFKEVAGPGCGGLEVSNPWQFAVIILFLDGIFDGIFHKPLILG